MKSSIAKYYHVDLEISEESGKWRVQLKDQMRPGTRINDFSSTIETAKDLASTIAHGYLTREYPDQQWPVHSIRWIDPK